MTSAGNDDRGRILLSATEEARTRLSVTGETGVGKVADGITSGGVGSIGNQNVYTERTIPVLPPDNPKK